MIKILIKPNEWTYLQKHISGKRKTLLVEFDDILTKRLQKNGILF